MGAETESISFRKAMIILIIALSFLYIPADFFAAIYNGPEHHVPSWFLIATCVVKFLASCTACAIACSIKEDRIDAQDAFLLRGAFSFLVGADFFMVLLSPVLSNFKCALADLAKSIGIILFMVVQTILIIRHSRNTRRLYRGTKLQVAKNVAIEIIIFLCAALPVVAAIYFKTQKSSIVFVAYGIYVIVSLYAAWGTLSRGFFPRRNAWMIAIGMTCFFLCDFNIGLSLPFPFFSAFVWIFYTPALLLLSTSGIDFAGKAQPDEAEIEADRESNPELQ